MDGSIKKVVSDKGFGFITPSNGGTDLFFHLSALNGVEFDDLREGDEVSFDIEDDPKGPRAANVTLK